MAVRPTRGRPGGGRGRGQRDSRPSEFDDDRSIEDTVVKLYRCATVVKGGRRFSFGALVVVGDRKGQVGFGYGKANEVPPAVEKGIKQARRGMFPVPLRGNTLPHRTIGRFGSSRIVLIPASPGTGVIAGSAPRAVLELAGVKDVLTKCYGSTSPKNLVKATIEGLRSLRTRAQIEALRGVGVDLPPEPEPEPEKERKAEEPAARGASAERKRETAPPKAQEPPAPAPAEPPAQASEPPTETPQAEGDEQ